VSGIWLAPWLCYRLPLELCPWHVDTSRISEHQVLWAFSGTFCLISAWRWERFLLPLLDLLWCSSCHSSQREEQAPSHDSVAEADPEPHALSWVGDTVMPWIATMLAFLIAFRGRNVCHTQSWHRQNI